MASVTMEHVSSESAKEVSARDAPIEGFGWVASEKENDSSRLLAPFVVLSKTVNRNVATTALVVALLQLVAILVNDVLLLLAKLRLATTTTVIGALALGVVALVVVVDMTNMRGCSVVARLVGSFLLILREKVGIGILLSCLDAPCDHLRQAT